MVSPGNRHCANCIGTLSFPIMLGFSQGLGLGSRDLGGIRKKANCSHKMHCFQRWAQNRRMDERTDPSID